LGLFSFKKKKEKPQLSPKQTIERIIEYMPACYEKQRQFINSKEFFEQNELGLSVDSLVELADESGHYFSEEFWDGLTNVARTMGMDKIAEHCAIQSKQNMVDYGGKIPFGWTKNKIEENLFEANISKKLRNEWDIERRAKDKVDKLLNKDGVHLKSIRGSGYIYYVEQGKLTEFAYETDVVWFKVQTHWRLPEESEFKKDEKERIKDAITLWAKKTKRDIVFDQ